VDLGSIKEIPIAIFAGKYDLFHPVEDSRRLRDRLNPNVVKAYYELEEHGHFTFV
jgi:pimeloyl-ACP methyl ester carboxylesterase